MYSKIKPVFAFLIIKGAALSQRVFAIECFLFTGIFLQKPDGSNLLIGRLFNIHAS